jgi:hypothetical protein
MLTFWGSLYTKIRFLECFLYVCYVCMLYVRTRMYAYMGLCMCALPHSERLQGFYSYAVLSHTRFVPDEYENSSFQLEAS